MEDYVPDLITSEILQISGIDITLDAQRLPFRNQSLRAIVMFDVFHHIPDVSSFLTEAVRCLKPGGVIVLHEPWITKWSKLVYHHFHHEPIDTGVKAWTFPEGGPLSQANSALPLIVFDRDKNLFEKKYPELRIDEIRLHTPFSYLLSGGVSMRGFMPGFLYPLWLWIENTLNPWMDVLAMFATITIQRKS